MDEDSIQAPVDQADPAKRVAWGVASTAEHRWPASISILLAMTMYLFLPGRYTLGPPWMMPLIEFLILTPLSIWAPRRHAHEGHLHQVLASIIIGIVIVANLTSLILLIRMLLFHGKEVTGTELFFSSFGIWVTNVIVFGLWYWEIDRGGPDQRTLEDHDAPDFLFPQMTTPGCSSPDWTPSFIDYMYLAFTNATAFSPTDVMPLTTLSKVLMLVQASISLTTITLVAARAVNILN